MNKKRKAVELLAVVLYGIVAVLWLVLCIRDFAAAGQVDGLRVLATVVWGFGFVVLLRRYLRQEPGADSGSFSELFPRRE